MAILRYKKDGDPNKIRAMPVISSVYTDYVIENTGPAQIITLTPSTTTGQTGAGAFENVVANIKFLNTNPTYAPALTSRTYTFSTLYGNNGFPSAVTVSAIPTTTLTLTPTETTQTETFNTTRGFPTTVTVNPIPSNYLNKLTQASIPPTNTTISLPSGTITIQAGYYSSDIVVDCDIVNKGSKTIELTPNTLTTSDTAGYYTGISASVKTLQNNPIYTPTTSTQNITYTSTGFPKGITINPISTITLDLTSNNTTYTIGSGSWTAGTYPTSIYVNVPQTGIDNSSGTAYTTLYNNRNKIPSGYRVYGSGSSSYVTGTMNSYTHSANTITNLTTQGATRTIEAGWHDGNETIRVNVPSSIPSGYHYTGDATSTEYLSSWKSFLCKEFTVYGSDSDTPVTGEAEVELYSNQTLTKNNPSVTIPYGIITGQPFTISVDITDVSASNIRSGATILGVSGTYTGSGIDTTISSTYAAAAGDIRSGKRAYVNGSLIYGSLNPTSVLEYGTAGSNCSYTLYQNGVLYYYTSSGGINGEVTSASSIVNKNVVTRIIFGAGINLINADFSNFNNIEKIEFVSHHEPLRIYGTYFHYKASTDGSARILVLPANLIQLGDNCFVNSYLNQVIFLGWRYDTSVVYGGSVGSASAFSGCTIALMKFPWANNNSYPSYIYPPFGATVNSYAYNSNPTGY